MVANNRKSTTWMTYWLGSRSEFSIRARLFHSVSLATCILLLLAIPINIMLGLYHIVWLLLALLLAHACAYLLSRMKKKLAIAIATLTFLSYSGVSVNYYLNSGIDGPTLLIFIYTFLLLAAVTKRKYHGIFFVLTCLVITSLMYFDFHYPSWVKNSFEKRLDRYLDLYLVFLFILLFVYLITRSLIDSYYYEKRRADQKALDLEIEHNKLEQLTVEKEKLFSIIFHDLKSPLNTIQVYLEMINDLSIEKQKEDEIKIALLKQTKETSRILDNVLFWAKEQLKNTRPNLQPVNVNDAVKACVEIENPSAQGKNVKLIMSAQKEINAFADSTMLQLLLRILINNAIKFTPKGSSVFIDVYEEKRRCLIKVKDSGDGISLKHQDKIFTLKIGSTKGTNNEKGAGLGLSLAYQFAARQQIDIWFNSRPHEGAEFFLALPIHPKDPQK